MGITHMCRRLRITVLATCLTNIAAGIALLCWDVSDEQVSWVSMVAIALMCIGSVGFLSQLICSRAARTKRLFTLGYAAGMHDANYSSDTYAAPDNQHRRAHLHGV